MNKRIRHDEDGGLFNWLGNEEVKVSATRGPDFFMPSTFLPFTLPEFFEFKHAKRIALDIETWDPELKAKGPGGIRQHEGLSKVVGVAVATPERSAYFPMNLEGFECFDQAQVIGWLKDQLRDFHGEIIGANLLYDFDFLATLGVRTPHASFRDVQWAAPLLDENADSYSLNTLLKRYLKLEKRTHNIKERYGSDYINNMHKVHPGDAAVYALGDVEPLFDLLDALEKGLAAEDLSNVYDVECRLFPLLLRMRMRGTRIARQKAEEVNVETQQRIDEILKWFKDECGWSMAQSMPSGDLGMLLEKSGVAVPRTKSGGYSVTRGFLEHVEHPIAKNALEVRKLEKFRGTFVQSYILEHAIGDTLHTQFHPLRSDEYGTVTGRFSSSNPNLQNIPARDDILGPLCRSMFIPRDEHVWWSRDYSQIEYRFLVHYALEENCNGAEVAGNAYKNNAKTDFHEVAAEITGVPRKQAKNINFGVVYGMGVTTMANNLGVDAEKAKAVLKQFHMRMPFIKQLMTKTQNEADHYGYIRTILGRKRRFDVFEQYGTRMKPKAERKNDETVRVRSEEEARALWKNDYQRAFLHKALNAKLQGSAADLIKKAMGDAEAAGLFDDTGLHCTLTVHDELDGESDRSPRAQEALKELDHIMSSCLKLNVPIFADGSEGKNWQEAKE